MEHLKQPASRAAAFIAGVSPLAVAALLQAGIDAVNLDGGMQAWHQAGGSVVAAPGTTPAVI